MKKVGIGGCILFLLSTMSAWGQYPATIKVGVTFYDFHSDSSCPDFNPGTNPGVWLPGMVADNLDPDGKPTVGTVLLYSQYVNKWFRPWRQGDDTKRPLYSGNGRALVATNTVGYDTSYKNMVFQDSLVFNHIGTGGQYEYNNGNFFPLDGRGFGADPKTINFNGQPLDRTTNTHNYSFAMQLTRKFNYSSGQNFNFSGDDDVWVFVNGKLVLDLGGIHGPTSGSFVLVGGKAYSYANAPVLPGNVIDTANAKLKKIIDLGLVEDTVAQLDFFYSERQAVGSDIRITSNIITAVPDSFKMDVKPDADTIAAGDSISYLAHVMNNNGLECTLCDSKVKWTLTSTLPTFQSDLTPPVGQSSTFHAVTAFGRYYITASFDTVINGQTIALRWYDTVWVKSGPAAYLAIQTNSNIVNTDPWPFTNTSPTQTVLDGQTQTQNLYAVLRDKFGNWVGYATGATWTGDKPLIATVANGARIATLGEGLVTRVAPTGTLMGYATQGGMKDSITIILSKVIYKQIRINVYNPNQFPIDTLQMRVDQDTTLWALGLRDDGSGIWEQIQVNWGTHAGMTFDKGPATPPTNVISWPFSPANPDTGIIFIADSSGGKLLTDTILAYFNYGNPKTMALYPKKGAPDTLTNKPYPAQITISAGDSVPLWAKLFDDENPPRWLIPYERTDAPITWTMQDMSGKNLPATLTTATGSSTIFTTTKAWTAFKVTATFKIGNDVITASILITVNPAKPAALVIEADSAAMTKYPNAPNELAQVSFGARDTLKLVYSVLRDKYGNFYSYADPGWSSRDSLLASAANGIAISYGEGAIKRVTKGTGQTMVFARDRTYTNLIDSVPVILSNITYDSLQIRVGMNPTDNITSITVRDDQTATIYVFGKESASGQWVLVPGNWGPQSVPSDPKAPQGSQSWALKPTDTGSGKIWVSLGDPTTVPDTIDFHFVLSPANSLVLYSAPGTPVAANKLPDPPKPDTAVAGTPFPVAAKLFDVKGYWLKSYETAPNDSGISWKLVEVSGNPPTGTLSSAKGFQTTFNPVRAYNRVLIIGKLTRTGAIDLLDTVIVDVVAGPVTHVVLEPDANHPLNNDNPIDTVRITANATYAPVYAVGRDALGNFVGFSTSNTWWSKDTIVSVADGATNIGEGIITRNPAIVQGATRVAVISKTFQGLTDTTSVVILPYSYTALRIVNKDTDSTVYKTAHITNLTMSTNDNDTTLFVIGKRSDNGMWENVSATWEILKGLPATGSFPASNHAKTFGAQDTGRGWIRVTSGDDAKATPDTVYVVFTQGPPVRAEIEILTPPEKRIAGEPITAVVRIYDKRGNLVRGDFPFDTSKGGGAAYHDTLGRGGIAKPEPFIIVDGKTIMLDKSNPWGYNSEVISGGIDTVKFTLYNAPHDVSSPDSLHQIYVRLWFVGGSLPAATLPFALLPGPLSRIQLEDPTGTPIGPDITVKSGSSVQIVSYGYDKYGNRIDQIPTDWSKTGDIPPIAQPNNTKNIWYSPGVVIKTENGTICAKKDTMEACVNVMIPGPGIQLVGAVTGDSDGDGLLDQLTLHFNLPITIQPGDTSLKQLLIVNGQDTLTVAGVVNPGRSDTVWVVKLVEKQSKNTKAYGPVTAPVPQTDWTPKVSIPRINSLNIDANTVTAKDGAPPVIWIVTKTLGATRSQDIVTVYLSEPVTVDNGDLTSSNIPSQMFHVWTKDPTDSTKYIPADAMIIGIDGSLAPDDTRGSVIKFQMLNGKDLTSLDYFTLDTGHIADRSATGNNPNSNNQHVQVIVLGDIVFFVNPVPNPSSPTFNHQGPGEFYIANNDNAYGWVQNERRGVALQFPVQVPDRNSNVKVECAVKIYDVAGNLVRSGDEKDFLSPASFPNGQPLREDVVTATIYWNGSNGKGMKVAPGVYRTVVFIHYWDKDGSGKAANYQDHHKTIQIGIGR
jgi:hypothetical protein